MTQPQPRGATGPARRVAVLSAAWGPRGGEVAFAARVLAGAASRLGPVDVFGPWPAGRRGDGAFDPAGLGLPEPGRRWPSPGAAPTPATEAPPRAYRAVLVDGGDEEAVALAAVRLPGVPVLGIGGPPVPGMAARLDLVPADGHTARSRPVGLHVPVHALAAERPHLELGPVGDYLLVLSARPPQDADPDVPCAEVAWLAARYPRQPAVVVENAVATVWRSRSCVRRFGVHTRMDLWRLMAHARATVDLGPGPLFGRECVESVRYGVPVVVPAASGAAALVRAGAGLRFDTTAGLLDAVGALNREDVRDQVRGAGAALEPWVGEPQRLVDRLAAALELPAPDAGPGGAAGRRER